MTIPPAPVTSSHVKTWPEFLSTLPAWEHDLLNECTECDDCIDLLFLELQWPSTIYVVSDGGKIGVHGSCGLVIGTEKNALCEGLGITRGSPMQSFHAEGYGHLAGLSYLKRCIEYYGISVHPKCWIKVFCDNEMLLKRLTELRNLPEHQTHASHYVGADVDVLLTILQLDLPFRYGSDHVKGHQDNHAMADELREKRS